MGALTAEVVAAPFAAIAAVIIREVSAVAAGDARPAIQSDVRGMPVVGLQHLTDQDEEVAQSALLQR